VVDFLQPSRLVSVVRCSITTILQALLQQSSFVSKQAVYLTRLRAQDSVIATMNLWSGS
jgi:hypothetical protein